MIEFQETSRYSELYEIASMRNNEMLTDIREIAPSVHRVVKLRGRPPSGRDIDDVLYDFNDYESVNLSRAEVVERLGAFSLIESTYYRLGNDLACNTAAIHGLNHRIDDLVDLAKDTIGRVVWGLWNPEKGEDFIDLHKRVCIDLRYHLIHLWARRYQGIPSSYVKDYVLEKGKELDLTESTSPDEKPIHRLRKATMKIPLPVIIARIDSGSSSIEKISTLGLMGYYPDGRGYTGIASKLGVKRDTLSSALDRAITRINKSSETVPIRPIREIVSELLDTGIMKYKSGKNVEFDSPRLKILYMKNSFQNLSSIEDKILAMTISKKGNTFSFSLEEIAKSSNCSPSKASKIINKLADSLDTIS